MLRPIILTAVLLAFGFGALAEDAPGAPSAKCPTVESMLEGGQVAFKVSDPVPGVYVDNARKLVSMLHGNLVAVKDANAIRIALGQDGSAGVFFMQAGCVVGLIPIPPQHLNAAFSIIAGAPKTPADDGV